MGMISGNDKSIEDLDSRKRMAEDEPLYHKEVAKETTLNLEEAMSLQKQQHLSSTETPERFLKIMDEKLSVIENELNCIKEKCVPNEEKLDGIDKEIRKYCNERD